MWVDAVEPDGAPITTKNSTNLSKDFRYFMIPPARGETRAQAKAVRPASVRG